MSAPIKDTKKLGALVLEAGLATPLQIDHALQSQHVFGGSLGTNLVEMGIMDGQSLAAFLAKQYGVLEATPQELADISPEAIHSFPKAAAEKLCILPLRKQHDDLVVAMMDPSDDRMIKKIEENLGFRLICKVASELEIRKGLKNHYGISLTSRFLHLLAQKDQNTADADPQDENVVLEHHLDKIISPSEAITYYFEHIRSLDRIPVLDYVGDITQYNLSSALVFIFQQVDGVSTIQDLISLNIFPRLSTLRSLVYFSKLGMIRFMEKAS
jgi:hypothetical protein